MIPSIASQLRSCAKHRKIEAAQAPHIIAARAANMRRANERALALLTGEWQTAKEMADRSSSSALTIRNLMMRATQRGLAQHRFDGVRNLWRKA